MPTPTFFIIGAPKAATTSLSVNLSLHPDVCMVAGKEPHFFSMDQFYALGWDWYMSLFAHYRGEKAIGDASTTYSRVSAYPLAAARIARHAPDARIIYMVRHPVRRMESAYVEWMSDPKNHVSYDSINDVVRRNFNPIDTSRYFKQISAYRRFFPDERIKIVFFEDYVAGPVPVLEDVFRFVGVDPAFQVPNPDRKERSRSVRMARMQRHGRDVSKLDMNWDPATLHWAIGQIADDVRQLLEWCGKPADFWRLEAEGKS